MPSVALVCSLVLLAAVLVAVVRQPGGRGELWWTGPAAALVLATGLVDLDHAADTVRDLGPTLAFLAAMFAIARVADVAGLFDVAATRLAGARRHGQGTLLAAVAVAAVLVTTLLSLDATAVLLTPVVVAAARGTTGRDRPLLATVFLANGASLLLPVANLTNLLALEQLDLSFPSFAARMALPTLATAVVITVGCRLLAPERAVPVGDGPVDDHPVGDGPVPGAVRAVGDGPATDAVQADRTGHHGHHGPSRAAPGAGTAEATLVGGLLVVLLVAFVAGSVAGIEPALVAVVGAIALAGLAVGRRLVGPVALARSIDPGFLAFVATLGIVVAAPAEHGLTRFVADRLPSGQGLGALLVVAFGAALLANLVTNLPATLVLLPALATRQPPLLLAALIGVNVGPNLTVTGSLATLLWRRVARAEGAEVPLRSFLRVGLVTTPVAIAAATVALWASLAVLG